ncbi:LCP family protein [Microbacterium sp. Leaf320]|uniref:LCP family protein n=1 Tax=Microbacterium sp. Leaf320 TaxID=1736334 RepID=UPI0006F66EB7|nr:LCP family protein [Microbacterium sp. Leaf320]KQQ65305.1 transcriptional regulator [Microbacterium sp. Leaf320]
MSGALDDAKRSTVARHADLPTPSALSTFLKLLGVALSVLLVSSIAVAGFVFVDVLNRVGEGAVALEDDAEVAPPSLGAYPSDKAFSILIVGTDECGEVSTQLLGERCEKSDEGSRNDVNLLVHVSAAPRNVTVVSFPRDLMVEVPECTRDDGSTASSMAKAPLNSLFDHAGISCIAKTVSDLSGIPIEFAAKISFDGVIAITDAMGGVEVCVAGEGIRDSQAGIDLPVGTHTVSGANALAFIRTRHGVGDESDLARISNQQQYMSRLAKKILSAETLTDPSKVLRLMNTVADNIVPSQSLSNALTLTQLALALKDVRFSDFVFVQYPNLDDPDNPGIKVVPDYDAAEPLWAALIAGEPITLSGDVATNSSVELATPPATEETPETSETAAPTEAPETRATLPPEISGQSVDQDTCSVGNQAK